MRFLNPFAMFSLLIVTAAILAPPQNSRAAVGVACWTNNSVDVVQDCTYIPPSGSPLESECWGNCTYIVTAQGGGRAKRFKKSFPVKDCDFVRGPGAEPDSIVEDCSCTPTGATQRFDWYTCDFTELPEVGDYFDTLPEAYGTETREP